MSNVSHTGIGKPGQMQNLGIKLIAVSYCCIGALLGQCIRGAMPGQLADWLQDRMDLLVFSILGNFLGLTCLIMFFRRRGPAESPLISLGRTMEVLVRGLPANNRVALVLFSTAWAAGLLLGLAVTLH